MRNLHIGPKLTLPPDTVTGTMIVYGGKGLGKSVLAAVVCEELSAAGQRFAVIDPMGVFWGLRHSADGKGPGIEVLILGGKYGDIPIEPTGGRVVADLVADESVDVVIDISRKPDGKMWSRGERIRFVADYCERLYERQGERRRPLLQVIDECGRFCPEQIRKDQPEIARCLGAVAELVEEARNVGVGVMLITQRSARMSKSVSELADAMFAFRTVGPRSVEAITDWLGEHVPRERHKNITEELRKLPRGSALVVSPGWLEYEGVVEIRMRHTFDSSATPKAGKEQRASGKGAMPDLRRYQERMVETIERVKAADPTALQKQLAAAQKKIGELEKNAGRYQGLIRSGVAVTVEQTRAVKKTYEQGFAAGVKAAEREYFKARAQVSKDLLGVARDTKRLTVQLGKNLFATAEHLGFATQAYNRIEGIATRTAELWEADLLKMPSVSTVPTAAVDQESLGKPKPEPAAPRRPREPGPPVKDGDRRIVPAEQKILDAIAEFEALRIPNPARVQVAFMAGYTNFNSKGFKNAIGALRTASQIDYPSPGTIALTEAGRNAAVTGQEPLTSKELQKRLMDMLGGANARILDTLIEAYPESVDRQELGSKAGYGNLNSKGFKNAIGRLRSLGLIDYPGPGQVKAQPVLFLDDEYETA